MKRLSGLITMLLLAAPMAVRATDATWVNNGTIVVAPNIDATNFINNGTMLLTTSLPFDTSNTRNFTNNGTMTGSVGFKFDLAPRNSSGQLIGARSLAANFHNRTAGAISAQDGLLPSFQLGSYLYVQATNVINQGLLSSSAQGYLQIVGTNVNLSRGGVGVTNIPPLGTGSANGDTNFVPDTAIYDSYWGQTNADYPTANILRFFGPVVLAVSPFHDVSSGAFTFSTQVGVVDPVSAAYTNVGDGVFLSITNQDGDVEEDVFFPTNITRQAVFVATSDPINYSASIRFFPSSSFTNPMQTVAVELAVVQTNVVTASSGPNTIYFVDTLASETNQGTLLNINAGTFKPANYLVSRLPVVEYFFGSPGNAVVTTNFLWDRSFGGNVVTAPYAGYSAFIDNVASRPPNIPAGTVTNLPGRVDVFADSLDLTRARVGTDGLITLQARHLISSSNAVVDCENLSFKLGSTNGLLRIQNLAKETVERVRGDIFAWSGYWTNSLIQVITNYDASTNPVVYAPITNVVNMGLHVLILDATQLFDTLPVFVHDLRASATNVVMSDNARVIAGFSVNGQSFTLTGRLSLSGAAQDWVATNAPTLRYFTNSGSLIVANEAHFGDDTAQPYLGFVNRGLISSAGQNITSDYVELAGTNQVAASLNVNAGNAVVQAGRLNVQSDIVLTADTLKFHQALVQSGARLYLNVDSALFDNGAQSSNTISTLDGFTMSQKPASGDLLGTTFSSVAPNFANVTHVWAGEDRGDNNSGFSNNVALGTLALVANGPDATFEFSPAGGTNALYVDYLNLLQLADYANQIVINPGLTIYYAAAKLNFTPPGGLTPEEYLNHQFGDRLRWVPSFVGPNSSVDVVINGGQTIKVNRALRNSTVIDSDSDGVPNYYDLSPFDGVTITSISYNPTPAGYLLQWNAAPNTVYRVEYASNLTMPAWTLLTTTTNTADVTVPWSVVDTNVVPVNEQRYYRVTYNPTGP